MRTLLDLYERNATLYPDRTAFVCDDRRESYAELLARMRRLASAIERAGVGRQERVGIFALNSIECLESYGACDTGAFIAAALNYRSAAPELVYLLNHSTPSLLIFDETFTALVDSVRDRADSVRRYVCIGDKAPEWATGFEDFITEGDVAGPSFRPKPEDFCTIFYTSGTTGRPKGVPYRHDAQIICAERTARSEEASLLQISPAFHVGGRCAALGPLWVCGKVVLHRSFDATAVLEAIERERINATFMVPMMMQAILDHPDLDHYDLSSLEWVMAASTAIPPPLLARAIEKIGQVFYVAYGSTEGGGMTRLRRIETRADGPPEMTARLASVGHAETPVEIRLLDDDGNEVPQGDVGEVCVRSYCFVGYWNDPVATAAAMHGDFVRTGDMGRFDERRYLYLVDRKKDMIISGGENIYSREVEDALSLHPAVREVGVIGIPDATWGERVIAVVSLRAGEAVDAATLIAHSQTHIARYKCPKEVVIVDALPLSATGKIDKVALRSRYTVATMQLTS